MAVGKTFGDQCREARIRAAAYNEKLATQAGAAELLDVGSPETIGRWERDEAVPSNINVRRMAQAYNAPELLQNYCAMQCPIGCGRVNPCSGVSLEQTAIRLFNEVDGFDSTVKSLLVIAADGEVSKEEADQFNRAIQKLGNLKSAITALQIYAEKHNQ